MLSPTNPVLDTWIFGLLLGLAVMLFLRKKQPDKQLFTLSVTQELKGFAILVIIFGHIGYEISSGDQLLWPLSNLAGVGVNLFLFVSGYGLTTSSLRRKLSIGQFYAKRLKKLYVPFWLVIGFFILLDFLVLQRTYPLEYIVKSFAGIFETADTNLDLNSPLWYFSLIAFYYLIYPLVFIRRHAWLSALTIFSLSVVLLKYSFIGEVDNAQFYKVYTVAFPLGILIAWIHHNRSKFCLLGNRIASRIKKYLKPQSNISGLIKNKIFKSTAYYIALVGLLLVFFISRYYSGPDQDFREEQFLNIISVLAIVLFFILKRFDLRLFYIFGLFSYEIYLLHWPLISRYDFLFSWTPAWLAIVLYLFIFLLAGWLLQKLPTLSAKYIKSISKH